jgi:hypothetical protein
MAPRHLGAGLHDQRPDNTNAAIRLESANVRSARSRTRCSDCLPRRLEWPPPRSTEGLAVLRNSNSMSLGLLPSMGALIDGHVFGQQRALTARRFTQEAKHRSIDLRFDLQRLLDSEILLPLFGIRYDAYELLGRHSGASEPLTPDQVKAALNFTNTDGRGLLSERDVGDLFDPAVDRAIPMTETKSYEGMQYAAVQYLYSPYQILGARDLPRFLPKSDSETERISLDWSRASQRWWRNLSIILSTLEAAFRPAVVPSLSGFDLDIAIWSEYHATFDVAAAMSSLGVDTVDLIGYADRLLSAAHLFDPLRDWHELVDLIHFGGSKKLRGEALLAWEYRVAAEILLQAYESEVKRGDAPPFEEPAGRFWTPRNFRIAADRTRLNQVLTAFGLSPHPSVLIVVEGEIEQEFMIDFFDGRLRPGWQIAIAVQTSRGVTRDISELATFVAPQLTADDEQFVRASRPVTHVLIAGDPEGALGSASGREVIRRRWVDRFILGLPPKWRTDSIRQQIDRIIEVSVWSEDRESFEFAHFTDRQLARAIREVSRSRDTPKTPDLIREVSRARSDRSNIRRIWDQWESPKPSKRAVVGYLKPHLFARMNRELSSTMELDSMCPISKLALRALQLASSTPRSGYIVMSRTDVDKSSG